MTVGLSLGALVVGCGSSRTKLDRELQPFVGQNVTALSAVLGDPESTYTVGSERQYTWQVDNRFTLLRSRSGFKLDDPSNTPQYPVVGGVQEVPMHYECNLRVVTDRDAVIKSLAFDGE
jgi:hypothetical protein